MITKKVHNYLKLFIKHLIPLINKVHGFKHSLFQFLLLCDLLMLLILYQNLQGNYTYRVVLQASYCS